MLADGQLGSESLGCENAAVPGFLATHMVNDADGTKDFELPASGQFCSYSGIADSVDKPEETDEPPVETGRGFSTPDPPGEYQEGDGNGNICGAWAFPDEPLEWGLQTRNSEALQCECSGARCGMQRYVSLDGQGLGDRPWASYFANPVLTVYNAIEPLLFQPAHGGGWGYLCPVLEDQETGNILEMCFEEWRSYAVSEEWDYEHVAECKAASPGFEHNVDRVVLPLPDTSEFRNEFDEPIEHLSGKLSFETAVGDARLEEIVKLDDTRFELKDSPGGGVNEPELGLGCGRVSSTAPQNWALIGVSNGMESWDAGESQSKLFSSTVKTSFEPHAIEIREEEATAITGEQATIEGSVDPYGFSTKYVVEYGPTDALEKSTTEVLVGGSGTSPVAVATKLTGLLPSTTYDYRIVAFHYEGDGRSDVSYGPDKVFTTVGTPCSGANITGHGGSEVDKAFEDAWSPAFNSSSDKYACDGAKKPTASFAVTSSQAGLESWGVRSSGGVAYGRSNAFIGGAEPLNAGEIAEVEGHETSLVAQAVETIPVAQVAVAVYLNLPTGCTANSESSPGRLGLSDAVLEGIFQGTITRWNQIEGDGDTISGAECDTDSPIERVVRKDQAGSTHILKRYLGLIDGEPLGMEAGGSKTWNELSEGVESTVWPAAASVVVPSGSGDGAQAAKVAETPGSIGYGTLSEVRASGKFSPGEGGPGTSRFWVEVQNGEVGKGKSAKATYADPSTNEDAEAVAEANCAKTAYTNSTNSFPPPDVFDAWNEVTTGVAPTKEKDYGLCGLEYVLALRSYSGFPGTEAAEATRAMDFLRFVVDKAGGQKAIDGHDYAALPKEVDAESVAGASEIAF
jgi:ABC-type phosphate transport system substrate-binding protein